MERMYLISESRLRETSQAASSAHCELAALSSMIDIVGCQCPDPNKIADMFIGLGLIVERIAEGISETPY